MNRRCLVSDVGGTNTRVGLAENGEVDKGSIARFRNADHAGLGGIYARYLSDMGSPPCAGACIAMAGPVMDGVGRMTNIGWSFDRAELAESTGAATTSILNDLQAQGHAVSALPPESLHRIVPGQADAGNAAELVIGIGTGFNAVPVFRTRTGRYVPPCEAGHTTFPVVSAEDMELSRFVSRHHGYPGIEDVLSGRGLERVYEWASNGETRKSSAEIIALVAAGEDAAARRTADAFCRAFGRAAGDLALTHLPFGGIYIVGGMANAFRPHLERHGFAEAFRAKGRFSEFMDRFAVWMVEDDYAALTGCARHVDGLIGA